MLFLLRPLFASLFESPQLLYQLSVRFAISYESFGYEEQTLVDSC